MRERSFNVAIIIISCLVLIELFIKKNIIYIAIFKALDIWINALIPALFPFFIISDILINYNITIYIPKIFRNICKRMFNITDNMLTILLLSMISGFPSNARNTRTLYLNGEITLEEANHILIFSHFANPAFILSTVAVFFLKNGKLGIILLIAHYFSNFILGFLCRNNNLIINKDKIFKNKRNNFGFILVNAIKRAVDSILLICGVLVIFLVLTDIIINTFSFSSYTEAIIKGIFEITIGISAISKLNIAIIYKMVITSCFLAFGGISVHVQVLGQIADTKINYYYFFIGRLYQMIISGIITFIVCKFIPL